MSIPPFEHLELRDSERGSFGLSLEFPVEVRDELCGRLVGDL